MAGLRHEGVETRELVYALVDAGQRFERTAPAGQELIPLGLCGVGRKFGPRKNEQQPLRFGLHGGSVEQLLEMGRGRHAPSMRRRKRPGLAFYQLGGAARPLFDPRQGLRQRSHLA